MNPSSSIVFIDSEISIQEKRVLAIGCIDSQNRRFHNASVEQFAQFIKNSQFVCGHNILQFDIPHLKSKSNPDLFDNQTIIDSLPLSPLLFPRKPYHRLLKDDKLQSEETNNPLNDAIKAKELFEDEVEAFQNLDTDLQTIFYQLLHNQRAFSGFFKYLNVSSSETDVAQSIQNTFGNAICSNTNLTGIIRQNPVSLAYCLALLSAFIKEKSTHSITPPWVLKNHPEVEQIMFKLRNNPCVPGCAYCNEALDAQKGLKRFFGFDAYRTFDGEPLQQNAVEAALHNKSILAVFPTGGGKSITFQVPALMSGENARGLTIVISPLQSLMKDQVDNLERAGITDAVTINGLLDPIERSKAFQRVEDGSATLLYISPESLRSKTIERIILGRKITRFVIDEAHCFSSWGQDFRVDYLYIGDFIKSIQTKKNLEFAIPVSCFTATAKQKVIEDIRQYFQEKLALDLELFTSKSARTNLQYKVFQKAGEEEKYQSVRDLVEQKNCPTIVYVSRTRKAYQLAERLTKDGLNARPYHGKMDVREKTANQNAFIEGQVQIMVATSAFGMGVDKKDVGMVIHYEISDSLENYIQEAGRAGRDASIVADCYVLFNEEDLSKHFILLNQTKLSIKEIQQVWKAIKHITRFRAKVSNSALEIARKAGWDDNVVEIETRVTSAISALEEAGYLKRGQNMPRIFANSIQSRNAQDAIETILSSDLFDQRQKEHAVRIIKKLFSSKSRKTKTDEVAESRVDYISDHLGIVKEEVIGVINLMREEKILADAKDLTAFVKKNEHINRPLAVLETFGKLESFLLAQIDQEEKTFHIKELNEMAQSEGDENASPNKIKTILNFWAIKHWVKRRAPQYAQNHVAITALQPLNTLAEKLEKRHNLARFILKYLHEKSSKFEVDERVNKSEVSLEFSVLELKEAFDNRGELFEDNASIDDVEDALFYLSRIDAIKIEGGFLVVYNRLTIERLEQDNKKRYTKDDYQKLDQFYENKVQQIHIVGEYAKRMIDDYKDALQFVEDYFQLNYSSFLHKYFPGSKSKQLKLKMTPGKFRQLFGELSPTQLKIINDNQTQHIVVAAGPGSGKTKVLVHKLASLLLMEDVKHEQLLMLTFSRAAATEFKKRLLKLIGNAANFVEIKTFHAYCFDLLGQMGNIEKSVDILKKTIDKIKSFDVEPSRITKTVLVIDEAQDMAEDEFNLIKVLMELNEDMRVIAVGDDDQNIFEFRGAQSKYLESFIENHQAVKYELVENYRSKANLVDFSNQFVTTLSRRLKKTPIIPIQSNPGTLQLTHHHGQHLITPVVDDILQTDLSGTTCVLTTTNEEAEQITGLLLNHKMPARLIQSFDGFNLIHVVEVRYFIHALRLRDDAFVIPEESWISAKRKLKDTFGKSANYDLCAGIIRDFEATNPRKKYLSDLEVFIRESRAEDFFTERGDTIYVSTIHKAKGKEFDNVFLVLNGVTPSHDKDKRPIYVALTRAKNNLYIHENTGIFRQIKAWNIQLIEVYEKHQPPNELVEHLTHKDVWLDFFQNKQTLIKALMSGDQLVVSDNQCLNPNRQAVVHFSQSFTKKLEDRKKQGFELKTAHVNHVLLWTKEGTEIRILLPKVTYRRVVE
ncbi:MAG: RecQ family ATP-dependent DNA helicase [Cryomorphaceae bacterium]|nr:RecQ family ATP-dependent DNA helicase [Cryomorphaceae bacterium]